MLKILTGEEIIKYIWLEIVFIIIFFYFLGQNSTQFFINSAVFLFSFSFVSLNQSFHHYSYDQTWTNYEEPIMTAKLYKFQKPRAWNSSPLNYNPFKKYFEIHGNWWDCS